MKFFQTTLAIAAAFASTAKAGINCEGSAECTGNSINDLIAEFEGQVAAGKGQEFFYGGLQLGCDRGNICAFFQFGGQNGNLNLALEKARELRDHGCGACGSVPTAGGNPDVMTGALTFNYVSEPCCRPPQQGGPVSCYCEGNSLPATPAGAPCQYCF